MPTANESRSVSRRPTSASQRRATRVRQRAPRPYWRPPGLLRYAIVGVIALGLAAVFWSTRRDLDPMHALNRAFADTSLLLMLATLAIGPLVRIWPAAVPLVIWRREVGNWSVFAALEHVWIVLSGWVQWDLTRLFYSFNLFKNDWALDQGFALGNLLGIIALGVGLPLLATSNDASVRLLGSSGWKYLQQGIYVLFWLVVLHTAYFMFWQFVSFHRPVLPVNWFRLPFLALAATLLLLQVAAFIATVRRRKRGELVSDPGLTIG